MSHYDIVYPVFICYFVVQRNGISVDVLSLYFFLTSKTALFYFLRFKSMYTYLKYDLGIVFIVDNSILVKSGNFCCLGIWQHNCN